MGKKGEEKDKEGARGAYVEKGRERKRKSEK